MFNDEEYIYDTYRKGLRGTLRSGSVYDTQRDQIIAYGIKGWTKLELPQDEIEDSVYASEDFESIFEMVIFRTSDGKFYYGTLERFEGIAFDEVEIGGEIEAIPKDVLERVVIEISKEDALLYISTYGLRINIDEDEFDTIFGEVEK